MDNKTKLSDATKTLTEVELREIALLLEIIQRKREMCDRQLVGYDPDEDPRSRALRGLDFYAFDRLVEIEAGLRGS